MSSRYCIILILYLKILYVTCKGNSSLTFVIDDTNSMAEDIDGVKRGSLDLLDFVLQTKSSEIEDLILVTFNDPGVKVRARTNRKTEFIRALERIHVHGHGNFDCPEYSMEGIIKALENSRSDSYLYVFTDANAKDYHRVKEVINLCEKKQSQIIFVLTGKCLRRYTSKGYNVYYDIAKACSGTIINIDADEVHLAVDMIKHIVNDKKTIVSITTVHPHFASTPVSFFLDEKIEHAIITLSGPGAQFVIKKSNNFYEPVVPTEKIMCSPNFKVVKLMNNNPGTYTAWVKGNGEVSIVVYGKTDLTFEYGLSEFVPKSLAITSKQPIAGKEHYLSISVHDPEHEVNIEKAAILSTDEKVLMELPLKKIGTDFYVTDRFLPPETTFKVAVKGTIIKTGKPIVRISKISVQPRLPDVKTPSVTIKEGFKLEVNYGSNVSLTCEVSAYPKPNIQWHSESNILESQSSLIEFPYKYVSNLKTNNIKRSKSYICEASNGFRTIRTSIQINVIWPLKRIIALPSVTKAEFGKELKLKCLTNSSYPTETQWSFKGPQNKWSISADGSELTITDMDIDLEGEYTCKVFLKNDPKIAEIQKTGVKIDDLARPEVRMNSEHIAVPEQSKAIISCRIIRGTPRPKISWQYRKNDESESISLHESSQDLIINDVTLNRSGQYWCIGTNVFGKAKAVTELEVLKLPEIVNDGDSHAHVLYNDSHVFTCKVVAHPSPTILWKDALGNIVQSTKVSANEHEFTSRLDLQHIKNNGTFSCFAENSEGKSEQQFVITVEPPIKHGSKLNVVKEAKYGEEINLKCDNITSDFPIERNWIVNRSKEFIKSDEKYSLIRDANELVIKSMDINLQGIYVCRVRLEEDPNVFVEKNIELLIKDLAAPKLAPSKEILNKTFIARCVITSGVPRPAITWTFKGDSEEVTDLKYEGEILTINNIQRQHNGSYQCIGKNAIGTDRAIITLDIEEGPEIVTEKTEYHGVVGDKVLVVTCNATGYPVPKIIWKNSINETIKDDSKYIMKGSSNIMSLHILNPIENDTSRIICEAENKVGTTAKTFAIVVTDVPELGNKQNVYLLEKESKDINCTLPDSENHSLRWYKNGYLTNVTGTTYSIKRATVTDDGNYTCRANTDVGSLSETFVVDVGYKPMFDDDETLVHWLGDEDDVVDCNVEAKPAANVEWLVDGVRTDVKIFEHTIHGWGKYKCIVTNVHGIIKKTTTVTTSGCLINRTMEEKNNPPFILNTNINVDSDEPLLNNNNYMFIDPGQQMKLTCYKDGKNTFHVFPDKDTIIAECDREDQFNIEGKTYKYTDLKCKTPLTPTSKPTKKSCIDVESEIVEIGFEVPNFVKIYEICYDNKRSLPNFGYSKLSPHNLGNHERNGTGTFPSDNVKDIYFCDEDSECCYGKGQLVNAADVDIGPPQITPFVSLNAISVWKPCEKENRMTWRKLEEVVRSLLPSYRSIQVWSGACEYENVDVRKVPRYLWKVLKVNKDIIAVMVYVNTPEPKTEDIKCKKPDEISSELKLGDDPFTYLCSLEEFSKAFAVPMDTFNRNIVI